VFSLCVRDHIMIAHSFTGEVFGPVWRLHGATFVVDVEFRSPELDEDGLLMDIGLARESLRAVLDEIDYRNLDDMPDFKGRNTTTEFLPRVIYDRLAARIGPGGFGVGQGPRSIKVTLNESSFARASYEAEVAGAGRGWE
jgi:6-pyruvoyl-tetrahydropterin synthase